MTRSTPLWVLICMLTLTASSATLAWAAAKLIPTGLQAAGDGKTVFLCLPEIAKGNTPEFAVWYHPANRRSGAGGLWRNLYPVPLLGHPACITTIKPANSHSRSSTLVAFFPSGTGWEYSSAGRIALTPLPHGFAPVTACDTAKGLTVLGEVEATPPTHPPAASAATHPSPGAAPAKATAKAVPAAPLKAVAKEPGVSGKAASRSTANRWLLLQLQHRRWTPIPLPAGFLHIIAHAHPIIVEKNSSLWLFANRPGPVEVIHYWRLPPPDGLHGSDGLPPKQSGNKQMAGTHSNAPKPIMKASRAATRWKPYSPGLTIAASAGVATEFSVHGGVAVLVACKSPKSQMEIKGGIIRPEGNNEAFKPWIKPLKIGRIRADKPLTDLATARDGDGINVLILGPKGDISSLTLTPTGEQIYGLAPVAARKSPSPQPPSYPQFLVLALVTLLVFSLWQRKAPVGGSEAATFKIALLRQRLAAALVDMALAAGVIAVIFKLYDYHAWQPIIHAAENILAQPDLILSTPPLVMWLSLYELHVILGEALFGRSIGKAIFGIQVVDITGKPAGPLAVLIRNLIRIPEMITIFLLIFMFVSEERQRLGDLIARTIVIRQKK